MKLYIILIGSDADDEGDVFKIFTVKEKAQSLTNEINGIYTKLVSYYTVGKNNTDSEIRPLLERLGNIGLPDYTYSYAELVEFESD